MVAFSYYLTFLLFSNHLVQLKRLPISVRKTPDNHYEKNVADGGPPLRSDDMLRTYFRKEHRNNVLELLMKVTCDLLAHAWSSCKSLTVDQKQKLVEYVQNVLHRSHVSYSVLALALLYLSRIKPRLAQGTFACHRTMFLAALILAGKYLQDRNFRASAWAQIAGLGKVDLIRAEKTLFEKLDYELYVSHSAYSRWAVFLLECVEQLRVFRVADLGLNARIASYISAERDVPRRSSSPLKRHRKEEEPIYPRKKIASASPSSSSTSSFSSS